GTRSILRAESWFPRHGSINVLVGEPVQPEEFLRKANEHHFTAALMLRDEVRAWILRHTGEPDLAHEHPPLSTDAHPPDIKAGST
ncbi:MAG: hypothetical protein KAI75_06235, partial [Desulfobulbaceae bacterium]|nr:hypothetical protein [Desulfobulbaceae bacterium]